MQDTNKTKKKDQQQQQQQAEFAALSVITIEKINPKEQPVQTKESTTNDHESSKLFLQTKSCSSLFPSSTNEKRSNNREVGGCHFRTFVHKCSIEERTKQTAGESSRIIGMSLFLFSTPAHWLTKEARMLCAVCKRTIVRRRSSALMDERTSA